MTKLPKLAAALALSTAFMTTGCVTQQPTGHKAKHQSAIERKWCAKDWADNLKQAKQDYEIWGHPKNQVGFAKTSVLFDEMIPGYDCKQADG